MNMWSFLMWFIVLAVLFATLKYIAVGVAIGLIGIYIIKKAS